MGKVTLRVVSADIAYLLRSVDKENIPIQQVKRIDDLTVELQVKRSMDQRLRTILRKHGVEVNTIRRKGIYWKIRALIRRPVLLCTLTLLLMAGLYLPTRIFFLKVEGNTSIPSKMILEAAAEAGITFGASAREVRSEKIKNALLERIPQLQWAGINTSGCVATISVREGKPDRTPGNIPTVSSIVAVRDGIICDMTVTGGNPVCKVGQAVSAGQVLISGYQNYEQSIHATRSTGEIYASTVHKIDAVMPAKFTFRGQQTQEIKKISVIFGKKRINFYSGSGILDSSCVKMYEENYVTLPGGFQLPIRIVTETWITCQQQVSKATLEQNTQLLSVLARRYLKDQMIAGTLLSENEQFSEQEGVLCLTGEFGCIEMIGREQIEEIIKP